MIPRCIPLHFISACSLARRNNKSAGIAFLFPGDEAFGAEDLRQSGVSSFSVFDQVSTAESGSHRVHLVIFGVSSWSEASCLPEVQDAFESADASSREVSCSSMMGMLL